MDTPNNAGEQPSYRQRILDSDIQRRELAKAGFEFWYHVEHHGTSHSQSEALTRLAQKISQGDRALQDKILRRWGVRR